MLYLYSIMQATVATNSLMKLFIFPREKSVLQIQNPFVDSENLLGRKN